MSATTRATVARRGITKTFTFWQDREIRFDATPDVFDLRANAEEVLATFHHVEDTKGNNGQTGTLLVTNLRLIWWSARRRSVNLSVGYYCVLDLNVQPTKSKLFGGDAEALFVGCKYGSSRFMFVFTYIPHAADSIGKQQQGAGSGSSPSSTLAEGRVRLHGAVSAAWKAYDSTRIYREIRLRHAIIASGNLILLDGETLLSKLPQVTNAAKDVAHEGTLITTNVRVVWVAKSSDNFNVSLPYLQLTAVRTGPTRFGSALVVETSSYAGNLVLGFVMEPAERLQSVFQEVTSLWKVWTAKPILGMRVNFTTAASGAAADSADGFQDDGGESAPGSAAARAMLPADVLEQAPTDAFAAYYADEGQKGADRKPTYDASIGLAVEKLRRGVTLQDLWNVTVI